MNFDRLAPHYDWMEWLLAGQKLNRARSMHIDLLRRSRHILTVGEGHGRFATLCAAHHPLAKVTCIELSPKMICRAKARIARDSPQKNLPAHLTFYQADILDWDPGAVRFDAVVTCFFLDCFPSDQLHRVVGKITSMTNPEAIWLNKDFSIPPGGISRVRAKCVHAMMYAFFRRVVQLPAYRLEDPSIHLARHGWRGGESKTIDWGLITSTVWHRVQ